MWIFLSLNCSLSQINHTKIQIFWNLTIAHNFRLAKIVDFVLTPFRLPFRLWDCQMKYQILKKRDFTSWSNNIKVFKRREEEKMRSAEKNEKVRDMLPAPFLIWIYLNWLHKPLDFNRGHGEIRFENGAYTIVREYFEPNFNTAPG